MFKAYLPGNAGSHPLKEACGIVKQVLKTQSYHHLSQEQRIGCIAEDVGLQPHKGLQGASSDTGQGSAIPGQAQQSKLLSIAATATP